MLLLRVWIQLSKALINRPGAPIKNLAWILVLWMIPMLVVAPMFSRDVFSYAAQGEMVSHHINPYVYGPFTLGSGPYVSPVDPLWGNTPAPYGPLFLMIDGFFASVTFHSAMATVIALRLLELASVALLAWCLPKLARTVDRDPGEAFVLGGAQPDRGPHPGRGRPQRRADGRPARRRDHRGPAQAPRLGRRALRAGRRGQGAGRARDPLHRLGLAGPGRAVRASGCAPSPSRR